MQDKKEKIDKEVLLRYLKGRGSDDEKKIIHQWLDSNGAERELLNESLSYWDNIPPDQNIKFYDGDRILDRIYRNIKIEEGTFFSTVKPKTALLNYLTKIAAVIAIPLILASLFLYLQNRSFIEAVSWVEIHAPEGTRTNFYLPDGSKGLLNGGSSLKFPTYFTGKTRDVNLTGEAFFDIVSDTRNPFIVSTENIDVKVTGTSFNVMAYPDESITEVTLKTGKVEVYKDKTVSVGVLKSEELFIYNSQTDSGKIQSVNVSDRLSWIDGKLTFKYEPFDEVVRKLNRWYNVNIVLKDESLNTYIYYGTFQNESLDEVLKLLQYTAPIRYKDYKRLRKKDGTFEKRKIEIYCNR